MENTFDASYPPYLELPKENVLKSYYVHPKMVHPEGWVSARKLDKLKTPRLENPQPYVTKGKGVVFFHRKQNLWSLDLDTSKCTLIFPFPASMWTGYQLSQDLRQVAIWGPEFFSIFDVQTRQKTCDFDIFQQRIYSACISEDFSIAYLYFAGYDETIYQYDASTGKKQHYLGDIDTWDSLEGGFIPNNIAMTPDGRYILVSGDGPILIFNPDGRILHRRMKSHKGPAFITSDGQHVIYQDWGDVERPGDRVTEGNIVWNPQSDERKRLPNGNPVAISREGPFVAFQTYDQYSIVNWVSLKECGRFALGPPACGVAFPPNSNYFLAFYKSAEIIGWKLG